MASGALPGGTTILVRSATRGLATSSAHLTGPPLCPRPGPAGTHHSSSWAPPHHSGPRPHPARPPFSPRLSRRSSGHPGDSEVDSTHAQSQSLRNWPNPQARAGRPPTPGRSRPDTPQLRQSCQTSYPLSLLLAPTALAVAGTVVAAVSAGRRARGPRRLSARPGNIVKQPRRPPRRSQAPRRGRGCGPGGSGSPPGAGRG